MFGVLALAPLMLVALMFGLSQIQSAENSRIEALQARLQAKLEAYRQIKGHYPESLESLIPTSSAAESRVLWAARKMKYIHTDSGYELSYDGWCRYRLAVSNGVTSASMTSAK